MEFIQSNYMYNNNSNEQTYEHQNPSYENHHHYYDQHQHQSYAELDVEQELWNSSQNYGNTSGSEQMQSPGSSIKSKNFWAEKISEDRKKIFATFFLKKNNHFFESFPIFLAELLIAKSVLA